MPTKNSPLTNALRAAARPDPGGEPDGRRRRGNTSRARIVAALSQLVGEGDFTPGAARVAEVAGVSLRTVFRHFDEMDSLYREIAQSIAARVLPALFRPYRSDTWKERLMEMVDRRIELYEAILPFKVSGDLRRFQSEFLASDYAQHLQLEKMSLESLLPAEMVEDAALSHALRAATGFQNWRILRKDQELGVDDARRVVARTVEALLTSHASDDSQSGKRK
jgi:AcrR family transcriptional regulator